MAGDRHDTDQPRSMVGGRNLPLAIAVGLGLAAVFFVMLFWDPWAFGLFVVLLTTAGYVEVERVLRPVGVRLSAPVLVGATVTMLVGAQLAGHTGQAVGVVVLLVGAVLWLLMDRDRRDIVPRLSATVLFGLWVGLLASYAVLLAGHESGPVVVLAVIGAAALADVGAFAVGVPLGRHKLAPHVSPNKSWEGLVGGVAIATAFGAVVLPMLGEVFTPLTAAILVAACSIAAFVGDLAMSMVKRDLGVKDLGVLLPGHGGVLDRVDGILFALPVGYHLLAVLERTPT